MKVRNGFVSNSSSSSFIIHKSAFNSDSEFDKFYNEIVEIEEKLKDDDIYSYSWGESEKTYELHGNYIDIETYHAPKEIKELLIKYKITPASKDVYVIEY